MLRLSRNKIEKEKMLPTSLNPNNVSYISSTIVFDNGSKRFLDISGNEPRTIGANWNDVFNYQPYKDSLLMNMKQTNPNATINDIKLPSEVIARTLPVPSDPTFGQYSFAGSTGTYPPVNNTTGATGMTPNNNNNNGIGTFMNQSVLGIPLWVYLVAAGLLYVGAKKWL